MTTLLAQRKARKPRPGAVVHERYVLHDCVGRGGFGQVWRAEDRIHHNFVALKLLAFGVSEDNIARFKREFALLTELAHPHINPVLDFGHDATFGYFFTAAMVAGPSILAAAIDWSIATIELACVQALRALAYLHSRGVYHFDIKPGNLLVEASASDTPRVKLIDFGLASLHPTTEVAGTPSYMAPEFFLGQPADARADLYALGVVLYRCLTKRNPLPALTIEEARAQHLHICPPPPSAENPAVPAYLDTFVQNLLAKAPADRYASADHALRQLALLSSHPLSVEVESTALAYLPSGALLIGRGSHLEQIQRWLGNIVSTADVDAAGTSAVAIVGASGMGKTTLLRRAQFEAQLREYTVHSVWGPHDASVESFTERLAEILATPPTQRTLLVVDDVDHILATESAPQLRTLLLTLGERLRAHTLPHVLLCAGVTCMNDDVQRMCGWQCITLDAFDAAQIATYVHTVAPVPDTTSKSLAQILLQRTRGTPLLVEHAVKTLVQRHYLVDAGGRWRASQFEDIALDLAELDTPAALREQLHTSLRTVPTDELRVLHALAVWNAPVSDTAVEAICGNAAARTQLAALTRAGWLAQQHGDGQITYSVANELLTTTLLSMLSSDECARWHTKIAAYLQSTDQQASTIDLHLAHGEDTNIAHAALLRWCEHARTHGQLMPAIRALQKRVDILPPNVQCVETLLCLTKLQIQADLLEPSEHTTQRVEQLLRDLHLQKSPSWWQTHELRATIALRSHQSEQAKKILQPLFDAANSTPIPPQHALRLRNLLARAHMITGDLSTAEALYRTTWQTTQQLTPNERGAVENNELGQCLFLAGKIDAAIAHLETELSAFDPHASPLQIASRQNILAAALRRNGKFSDAQKIYAAAIDTARHGQDLRLLITLYNGLGKLAAETAQPEEAIACFERALPLAYRIGDLPAVVGLGRNLGHLLLQAGHLAPAESHLRAALTCAESDALRTVPLDEYRCPIHQLLGEIARQRHDWPAAERALANAWRIAELSDQLAHYRFSIQCTRAEAAFEQGDREAAKRWLEEAEKHPCTDAETEAADALAKNLGI